MGGARRGGARERCERVKTAGVPTAALPPSPALPHPTHPPTALQQCVIVEPLLTAADLAHTLDTLSKLAARVSGGHSVLQLVEDARRVTM